MYGYAIRGIEKNRVSVIEIRLIAANTRLITKMKI
jgi:hypothetical protein